MKKIRKITSTILTVVLMVLSVNVHAAEDEKPSEVSSPALSEDCNTDAQLLMNTYDTIYSFDSINLNDSVVDKIIEYKEDSQLSTLADTENTSPVADLSYMVANQDTLLDGNFTTDTIIYWLWSNGTTDYTYDPDGDEITGRFLGGINEYVLGNVTIGDKIVGFATKFNVAAQHELV